MVSQLVKHERIETTVAKVLLFPFFVFVLCLRHSVVQLVVVGVYSLIFIISEFYKAKEVRRVADNMVQLGKEVGFNDFF